MIELTGTLKERLDEAIRLAYTDVNEEELKHYGMPRRSGRYPWGSGENPYQHSRDFLSRVEELKKEGKSEAVIVPLDRSRADG